MDTPSSSRHLQLDSTPYPKQCIGLIEDAILMVAPVPNEQTKWRTTEVVAVGRSVDVYTTNDLEMGVVYTSHQTDEM